MNVGNPVGHEGFEPFITISYVMQYDHIVRPEDCPGNMDPQLTSHCSVDLHRHHCCHEFQSWNSYGFHGCQPRLRHQKGTMDSSISSH